MKRHNFAWLCGCLVVALGTVCWFGAKTKLNSDAHEKRTFTARLSPKVEDRTAVPSSAAKPAPAPDLTKLLPPSALPVVATEAGARASLRYLAANGADLTRPMPSKHRIFAANAQLAAQVADWGRTHGFEVRGPVLVPSHIGEPQQSLELVRIEVPDPAQIEREGRLVLAAVQETPGTFYQTWSGEIVR